MKVAGLVVYVLASVSAASAQQVIDRSSEAIGPDLSAKVVAAVTKDFFDPLSAQFRELQFPAGRKDVVCGFVNGKNRMGGYVGFSAFIYTVDTSEILIRSVSDLSDPITGELSYLPLEFTGCAAALGISNPMKK